MLCDNFAATNLPYIKRNDFITSRSQYMSSCACYKIGVASSNVLFFYLSTLSCTRFSALFASFLRNVHNGVIGNYCTSPMPSLRWFLEMKMHYQRHVSCRKRFTLLRLKATVYRKTARPALSRLLVARNARSCSASTHCCLFSNSHYYPSYTGLVTALVFPQYHSWGQMSNI